MGASLGEPEWARIEGRHNTPDALRRRRLDRTVLIEGGALSLDVLIDQGLKATTDRPATRLEIFPAER